jgi:negative regulator of flagellin synthesis FlgM
MKIQSNISTSIDATVASGGTGRSEERKTAAVSPASGASRSGGSTVRIDPRASLLAAAETSLASVSAVDSARVEEIKRAIAEGRFEVDSRRVAERLVGSVRDLILTRSN